MKMNQKTQKHGFVSV